MKRIARCLVLQICLLFFLSCGSNEKEEREKDGTEKERSAEKKETVTVPQAVTDSFLTRYPSAHHIEWDNATEHEQPSYKVKFRYAGKKMKAEFAPDGKFIKEKGPDTDDEKRDSLKK